MAENLRRVSLSVCARRTLNGYIDDTTTSTTTTTDDYDDD